MNRTSEKDPRLQVAVGCLPHTVEENVTGSPASFVYEPRLKISHCLFAARCVAATIDRRWLLACGYRPKPRLVLRCLRVAHDAADYWSTPVTEPHIVVALVPMVANTAFACRNKNRLCVIDLRMCHRWLALPLRR